MKKFNKIISTLAIAVLLCMTLSVFVGANASTPAAQTIKATAGEIVTITLTESNCYGISGSITYSNRALFSSLTPGNSAYGQIRENSFILSSAEKVECTVALTAKISDNATVGSKCVVSFADYLRVDNNTTLEGPDGLTKTVTVEVVEKTQPKPDDSKPTDKPQENKPADKPQENKPTDKPQQNKPTTQQPSTTPGGTTTTPGGTTTTPGGTTTTPGGTTTTPGGTTTNKNNGKLDYSALYRQINIAGGLTQADYTAESWTAMQTALTRANAAKNAKTQNEINNAATALKNAIASLVRVNAAELNTLLESATQFVEQDELGVLKKAVEDAIAAAEEAIKSGDAEKIAAAKAALESALNAYKSKIDELGKGEIVEVEKPVEVNPTSPFCNIAFHKLLIILLIVSFIINLGLGGLIGYYFYMRRKNLQDDTPLVDYNIDED